MKKILMIALSLYGLNATAQVKVGDNPSAINADSVLELETANKGVLYPRVALTAVANVAPLTAHVAGMVVYNTATANDVKPGLYINDGTKWAPIGGPASTSTGGASVSAVCNGFAGTYGPGISSGHTYTMTYTNNTFASVTVTPAVGDLVLNPASGLTVASVSPNVATAIASGATSVVTYTLSGTLNATPGTIITGTFTKFGLSCSKTVMVETLPYVPLPGNITLSTVSPHFIASAYDQDYLPYVIPTGSASLTAQAADGANEPKTIDFQGTLNTTGVTISIPYTVTTASVNLPAYTQTISIPASYTQDGIARDITFSYSAATLGVGSGRINATLKAVGGTLNVKKLDIQTGIGNDFLGFLLGQFTYAINNSGGTANFAVRAIAGIPDKNIANANHVMLYVPVTARDGKIWLNNNLGADYSNTAKAVFNPAQQATAFNDYNAYGSLFQWGRYSDGHELINWSSATAGTVVNGITTTRPSSNTPADPLFIIAPSNPFDWRQGQNNSLWQGAAGTNNPCPTGFRLPTSAELAAMIISLNDVSNTSGAKLSAAGGRRYTDGSLFATGDGGYGYYWTSSVSGTLSTYRQADTVSVSNTAGQRAFGFSVRCIKD